MDSGETSKYENILTIINHWSPEQRRLLLQDILESLKKEWIHRAPRQKTLETALGLLARKGPAPTDEEVKKWLEDHRFQKYS
ncbi:hypothetical protein ES703_62130 [subsurface metagenome]